MSCIDMKLNSEPFEQIKRGEKTVEVRLYDDKRRLLNTGDIIRFTNLKNNEEVIQTKIIALHRYMTFRDLFSSEQFSKCGFKGMSADESVKCMRKYYSEEAEKKYGVIGIELQIL